MRSRKVRITINTCHPAEHQAPYDAQAWRAIQGMQGMGIQVLFTGGHHRKLAIFDRTVLWEGSLNMLPQNASYEVMRRIESELLAQQMIDFIKLQRFLSYCAYPLLTIFANIASNLDKSICSAAAREASSFSSPTIRLQSIS